MLFERNINLPKEIRTLTLSERSLHSNVNKECQFDWVVSLVAPCETRISILCCALGIWQQVGCQEQRKQEQQDGHSES